MEVRQKVFISYSREDEAIAHMLVYILRNNRIECFIDRDSIVGKRFDDQLKNKIKESDLILVLLSRNAAHSPWVNHEIGFAIALEKHIWPISIEKDAKPDGMLSTTQAYSQFDWSNPQQSIDKLINALHNAPLAVSNPNRELGFKYIIEGKIDRTKFIVDQLREMTGKVDRKITILIQAAFSIFCASEDEMYRESGGHTDEYMKLLLEERRELDRLARSPNCSMKMILWPVRPYEDKYLAVRYKNLLEWMENVKDIETIDYVCAQYPGPNRIIVMGEFMIEGFKLSYQTGYGMTVVKYQEEQINNATDEFHKTFYSAKVGKNMTIKHIKDMYSKVSKLDVR